MTAERPRPRPVVCFFPPATKRRRSPRSFSAAPAAVAGHPVEVVVVDDGSVDGTAAIAAAAGARVVKNPDRKGLGATVRAGIREAVAAGAVAVAFLDADGEYAPEELASLVAPIIDGSADYVVGSRFARGVPVMRAHRRCGNRVLTAMVRALTRLDVTDGQSGYRALSAAAARDTHIAHDYNYAQVLTLDLVRRGFRYAEVPISYAPRVHGRSFVRLLPYVAHVLPAMARAHFGAGDRWRERERVAGVERREPALLVLDDVLAEPVAGA